MNSERIIFGITGTNGARKGTIVDFLINKKGFSHFSASGYITEEIVRRGLPVDRENMILVANDLRSKHGPDFIVRELFKKAKKEERAVIESIRTPGEANLIKSNGGRLLAVDADQRIRYERIKERKSAKDQVSFEEFVASEEKEMENQDPNKQNLMVCRKMADYLANNNGSLLELYEQIEEILIKENIE